MESAVTMLKDGATPAVVDFAEETLTEVSGVVIPAIIDESENDQRFIHSLHSRFEVIRTALATGNEEVHQLNSEEQALSGDHQMCRDTEKTKCDNKRNCEMEMYRLWTTWVSEEEELRVIHDSISGHFCPEGTNGTLHSFRVDSVGKMQRYMAQKIVVDTAEATFDAYAPDCNDHHDALTTQSSACNVLQTRLEEKACQHAQKISEVLTTYYADYAQALSAYNCATAEVMILEQDRKKEWVTLQVVQCLLERIKLQNGVPCDEANGGVTQEVGVCEERHSLNVCDPDEGEPRLCLEYREIPEEPLACPARDQVGGVCIPAIQAVPCGQRWHDQEYAALPPVPIEPFSSTNPGCNAYPACYSDCNPVAQPEPVVIDSCPGYHVDGCVGSDAEAGEHPLTFERDVDGRADVRCCSIDGETCQSQDFVGGVEFTNGGTLETPHTGCYFDVTYQEAMTVCHNAGMRICMTEEVQECCNTGCWHNHHKIWVDMADSTVQVSGSLDPVSRTQ